MMDEHKMTDAMTELVKLKKVVDKLKPLAAEAETHKQGREKAEAEVIEWKRIGTEAVEEKNKAVSELAAEKARASDAIRNYDQQAKTILALEKKLASMQMNAKYDATAREGQVKRSRIIQTELEETRDENQKLETRNNELEAINKELEKSRNHERALRLQDLHRNSTMAGAKKVAELHETEMEQRAAQISGELIQSREEVGRLSALVLAAQRVAKDHDLEIIKVRGELEDERCSRLRIDSQLNNTITTLEASVKAQRGLEMEVSRLRSEIVSTGAETGSFSQMMKAQPKRRNNHQIGTSAHIDKSGGWEQQLALESTVNKAASDSNWCLGSSTRGFRSPDAWQLDSGKQHFAYEDQLPPGNNITLSTIIKRPVGQEEREGLNTIGSRRRNGRVSRSAELSNQKEEHTPLQRKPTLQAPVRDHDIVHPGSLFVGSGLGLRKEKVSTKSATSRDILKNILSAHELNVSDRVG